MQRKRLLRITTVPMSHQLLLGGQLAFMREKGFDVLAVSAPGKETEYLDQVGIPHSEIGMTRRITPFRDLVAILQLIGIIRKFRPDIVHSHTPKAGLVGMAASWICSVPIRMHTVAGLPLMEATGIRRSILVQVERLTYWFATGVYPNSNGLLQFIRSAITKNEKVRILGKGSSNGIDTAYFARTEAITIAARENRARHSIKDDEIVFVFVGRIVRDKGIVELVEAFRSLSSAVRLMLVGEFESNLDPLPPDTAQFLSTDARVIMAGFQNDIRPWLASADVFVFPSYREGFPNVVMQAACMGLPCIVSDINGCNEIIERDRTGVLVKPKSSVDLAEAMTRLIENRQERINYAQTARPFVEANFDQKRIWELILNEYNTQNV